MIRSKIPPIGPRPKFYVEWLRIEELKSAIDRFLKSNWPIPKHIITEYNQLTEKLGTD